MICYSPMPQDKYVIKLGVAKPEFLKTKFSMGLGDPDFVPYPALWNYLVITSKLPFMWEDGTKKKDLPSKFTHLKLANIDMSNKVGDRTINDLVSTESPTSFLEYMKTNKIDRLEMAKFHGGAANLLIVIAARAYAWKGNLTPEEAAVVSMVKRQI